MEFIIKNGVLKKCIPAPGETDVNVPYSVKVIGAGAFRYLPIETVSLHRGITEIRHHAFEDCSELREIRIPPTVVSIGHRAFSSCKKLKSFAIPAGVQLCGGYELVWCELLREIKVYTKDRTYSFPVEQRVVTEMEMEFGYHKHWQTDDMLRAILGADLNASMNTDTRTRLFCRMLFLGFRGEEMESLILTNAEEFFSQLIKDKNTRALEMLLKSGRVLGELPEVLFQRVAEFAKTDDLLRNLLPHVKRLPEPTEEFTIRDGVLLRYNRKDTGTVAVIPENVTAIGMSAFEGCKTLREVWLPDGLQRIGNRAFLSCETLETIAPASLRSQAAPGQLLLPEGLESIGDKAFAHCNSLTSALLPFSLQRIGNQAFFKAAGLQSFCIPDTVKHLGADILYAAEQLDIITLRRRDGSSVEIPYEGSLKWCDGILNVILKQEYQLVHDHGLNDKDILEFVCKLAAMRFDNGATAEALYEEIPDMYTDLLGSSCAHALEILLQSGLLAELPLSGLLPGLIMSANKKQNYELQVILMNELHKAGESMPEDKRFHL